MSRRHRKENLWPADQVAVYIWHMWAVLEDIRDLAEASKVTNQADTKVALVKKLLVDLCSFRDLVEELRPFVYGAKQVPLPGESRDAIRTAIRTFDETLEPSRELLARIRNNLAAHRRGLPGDEERRSLL